jgi:hypothetical protein
LACAKALLLIGSTIDAEIASAIATETLGNSDIIKKLATELCCYNIVATGMDSQTKQEGKPKSQVVAASLSPDLYYRLRFDLTLEASEDNFDYSCSLANFSHCLIHNLKTCYFLVSLSCLSRFDSVLEAKVVNIILLCC